MRARVFETTVCIHKFPFCKFIFQPLGVAPGYHVFQENNEVLRESDRIRLHQGCGVLLHFKFIKPNLREFIKTRVHNNEDWEDSSEHHGYLEKFGPDPKIGFFDPIVSRKLNYAYDLTDFFVGGSKRFHR